MIRDNSNQGDSPDAGAIALAALTWILGEPERAQRFLALTGLDPASLRNMVGSDALHRAVLDYLAGYEPDMTACAAALGLPLTRFAAIHRAMST